MEIRQLRYFIAIVDSGSLSKAADQVFVAQPALSQQIAALESELNVKLLLRSSQGVKPTEGGKVFYRHARSVLRQIEQARSEVSQSGLGESGPVAVGLSNTIVSVVGVPLIKRVRAAHPGIRLHILESLSGYLAELLAQGRLDMAVLFRDTDTRGMELLPLIEEDLYLLGDPAGRVVPDDVCPMALLAGVPMALPSPMQGLRILIERSFIQAGIELNVVADIDAFPTNIALARDGFACTILPRSAVFYLGLEKRPTVRRLVEPGITRPVALAWSTSLPRTSAALAFQKLLVGLIDEMVESGEWTGVRLAGRKRTGR